MWDQLGEPTDNAELMVLNRKTFWRRSRLVSSGHGEANNHIVEANDLK